MGHQRQRQNWKTSWEAFTCIQAGSAGHLAGSHRGDGEKELGLRAISQVKLTSHGDDLSRLKIRVHVQMAYLGADPRKQVGNLLSILLGSLETRVIPPKRQGS